MKTTTKLHTIKYGSKTWDNLTDAQAMKLLKDLHANGASVAHIDGLPKGLLTIIKGIAPIGPSHWYN